MQINRKRKSSNAAFQFSGRLAYADHARFTTHSEINQAVNV